MKNWLLSLAIGTAMTVPSGQAAQAACIHMGPPEVHQAECEDAVDGPSFGGCSFTPVPSTMLDPHLGTQTGEIDIEAIVYSSDNPTDQMSATFTCYIVVNSVPQPDAVVTASGTVVVVGGGIVTYTSNDISDFVQLCQDVSYSNGVTTSECFEVYQFEFPPPVMDLYHDQLVCPVLALLAPGVPGVVDINNSGDVWLQGDGFYDCPPYGNVYGFPPNG